MGLLMLVFSCNHRVIREFDTFSFLAIHEWGRSTRRSHSGSHFRNRLFCSMSTNFGIVDLLPALNDLFSVTVKEWGKTTLAPVYGIMGKIKFSSANSKWIFAAAPLNFSLNIQNLAFGYALAARCLCRETSLLFSPLRLGIYPLLTRSLLNKQLYGGPAANMADVYGGAAVKKIVALFCAAPPRGRACDSTHGGRVCPIV